MAQKQVAAAYDLAAPLPFPDLALCTDKTKTVSHALAVDSNLSPKKAAKHLFPKPWFFKRFHRRWFIKHDLLHVSSGSGPSSERASS